MSPYPHTSGVALPDEKDFEVVAQTLDFIGQNFAAIGRSRRFAALAIALCAEGGVPLQNLRRYSAYYSLRDFVFAGDRLFFVAILPQKNGGIGSIPLPLGDADSLLGRLVAAAHADPRLRRRKFVAEALDAMPQILSSAAIDGRNFLEAIKRVSYYRCHYLFSGIVAAGLTGRLIIALNRVAEADIFASLQLGPPLDLDGQPWQSSHEATESWNGERDERAQASLLAISRGVKRYVSGERGMGRPFPASLSPTPATWSAAQWAEFAMLFGAPPPHKAITAWLDLVGAAKAGSRPCRTLALKIRLRLRRSGALRLDRPVRFVPLFQVREFVERIIGELRNKHPGLRGNRLIVGVLIAVALGPRPLEAQMLRQRDVRAPGGLITAHIQGVKKTARARREAIANFPDASADREWIVNSLSNALRLPPKPLDRLCDYNSASPRQFREAIGAAVKAAAMSLFGTDRGYNYYSLRHLCAWMLLQSVCSTASRKNFADLLGTIAANMGHSLPEFLGGYIGTGIIAVLAQEGLLRNLQTWRA